MTGEASPITQMAAGPLIAGGGAYLWAARSALASSYKSLRERVGWNPRWAPRTDFINTRLGPVFLVVIGLATFIHGAATP